MPDYASIYADYWSNPDRWGTSSLRDLTQTADSILNTCGPGRLLDAGAGMGGLVQHLLRLGIDAHGLDIANRCVEHASAHAPGRFTQGSLLELPFPDAYFDTVVCTDVLEHLAEQDVPSALAEMARVARRSLFIRVATTPDRDGSWHLTVRDRAWWERQCFSAGLRRHPLLLVAVPYETMEHEGWQATLVLEKIPPAALARYPLDSLNAERNLHMDMLREAGRRSDAHLARYQLACQFIRPGDTVLDAACGLGYGSAILAAGSPANEVLAIDESRTASEYGLENFAPPGTARAGSIVFMPGDIHRLSLPDNSVDAVVSFETLEHLRDPEQFLAEVNRVLRPAGRLIASVPNDWTDETGRDPNPHHLHVYDRSRLQAQVAAGFALERVYAQVAGGGMKHRDAPRSLREVPSALTDESDQPDQPAEWWIVVAMKQPVDAPRAGFTDNTYPDHTADTAHHVSAFVRDYQNPWLVRGMVALGLRCTNKAELAHMAERLIAAADTHSPGVTPASADLGAALCVLGYRLLDAPALPQPEASALLARLTAYEAAVTSLGPAATPHAHRWVISNAYMAAQLLLAMGHRPEARDAFRRCAAMDVLTFSPLLASKTIDASYHAGLIAACDGDMHAALTDFRRGLCELIRVLAAGDWTNIIGSIDEPLTFGLIDLQQGVELASRCAFAIEAAPMLGDRPGYAWTLLRRRALADVKKWAEQQTSSIEWLREQRRDYEAALTDARAWIATQDEAKSWLEQHSATLAARVESLARDAAEQRERSQAAADDHKKAARWLVSQRRELEAKLTERDLTIASLRALVESQKSAEQWRLNQKRELEARLGERDARIADLQAKVAKLIQGRDWLLKQAQEAAARPVRSSPRPASAPATHPATPPSSLNPAPDPATAHPPTGPSSAP